MYVRRGRGRRGKMRWGIGLRRSRLFNRRGTRSARSGRRGNSSLSALQRFQTADKSVYIKTAVHDGKQTDFRADQRIVGKFDFFGQFVDFARQRRQKPRRSARRHFLRAVKRSGALTERKIKQIPQRVF